ncbi:serine/threonine-protein kinase [bacterium]|nr:serine/threonine-protein kinase [bacterium]
MATDCACSNKVNTKATDLFVRAYELESKERETFLAHAYGDDAELRLEVERMLEDAEKADVLFTSDDAVTSDDGATISMDGSGKTSGKNIAPPIDTGEKEVAPTPPRAITEGPGSVLGPYKLLEQIGEGAFGVVFMAEQRKPIKRKVALKIIKPGMDTKEVIARFEAERQALALMDHSNIAKVLDAGATDTGRPYFAMELVKGVPVTEYCDTHCLNTRQRLNLFRDICAAVQHAHQKGIIHRDLKPSNILVALHESKPVVKVIDFGVAKAISQELTEKTLFTAHGQMIGTPHYMSPEQSEMSGLDIDTRSDVYSLGVVLYELLTGKTPLDPRKLRQAGIAEIHRLIREEEPSKPSTRLSSLSNEENTVIAGFHSIAPEKLNRLVSGDLDWIVMKALDKDRNRRYETATGFAADIENYLTDQPVTASPPSTSYKLRKFAKRNKAGLTTASLLLLMLVAGTVVSITQALRAEQQRKLAKQSAADAKAVVEFFETQVLAASRPDQKTEEPKVDITILAALDAAEPQISKSFDKQPLVEAAIRLTLGETYQILGEDNKSIGQVERSYELTKKTLGAMHEENLMALESLQLYYLSSGRNEEALTTSETMLAIHRELYGPEHEKTIRAMAGLAQFYALSSRFEEELAMSEKVVKLTKKTKGPEHTDTLRAMEDLADAHHNSKLYEKAATLLENILDLRRKTLGSNHPDTQSSLRYLTRLYTTLDRDEDATALRDEALKLQQEVLNLAKEEKGPEHPDTIRMMAELGDAYFNLKRYEEALSLWEEKLKLIKQTKGPDHQDTLGEISTLAENYERLGRRKEAVELGIQAVDLTRTLKGPEHPDYFRAILKLAFFYQQAGRSKEILTLCEKPLEVSKKILGTNQGTTLTLAKYLAKGYLSNGRYEDAVALREEMVEQHKISKGHENVSTLTAQHELVDAYLSASRYKDAVELGETTLLVIKKVKGPNDYLHFRMLLSLAYSYWHSEQLDKAEAKFRQYVTPLKELGDQSESFFNIQSTLGGLLTVRKKYSEAEPFLLTAYEGLKTSSDPNETPYLKHSLIRLTKLYQAWEKPDQAAKWQAELKAQK